MGASPINTLQHHDIIHQIVAITDAPGSLKMRIERTGKIEPLTPRVIEFLTKALNAVAMDEILSPEERRIDFQVLRGLLAIEVKTLAKSASERLDNFVSKLRERHDYPSYYGSVPIEAIITNMENPDNLRQQAIDRIGRAILSHLSSANEQLQSNEEKFPRRNRVRMVVLVNEDHTDYSADLVASIIHRNFKRYDVGQRRYGYIDFVLYLSERHAALVDNMIAHPIASIEGPSAVDHPWKSSVIDWFANKWATWSQSQIITSDIPHLSFEEIHHIPDTLSRRELWVLEYQRSPYLRHLSNESLRNLFDEVTVIFLLSHLKNSPVEIDRQNSVENTRKFSHIQIEMHSRSLPITTFAYSKARILDAAKRQNLPSEVTEWLDTILGA